MGIFPDCASKCWLSAEKGNDIIFVPYRQETVSNCERDWTRGMACSFGWKSGRIFTPISLLSKLLIGHLGWYALSEKRIVGFIRILSLFYDSIKINDIAEKGAFGKWMKDSFNPLSRKFFFFLVMAFHISLSLLQICNANTGIKEYWQFLRKYIRNEE